MGSTEEILYLSGFIKDEDHLLCPVESALVLFIVTYCENKSIRCCVIQSAHQPENPFCVPMSCIHNVQVVRACPTDIEYCTLPAIQRTSMVRTGLCAVLRHLIKITDELNSERGFIKLLGYKAICLKSCAEVSVWTKFCEVEMPQLVKDMQLQDSRCHGNIGVPHEVMKLENHLAQPPIIPNISKRRRQAMKKNQQDVSAKVARSEEFEHIYAEGIDMTLTDLILFPCITCYFARHKDEISKVQNNIPRVSAWYRRLQGCPSIKQATHIVGLPWVTLPTPEPSLVPDHFMNNTGQQSKIDVRDPNKKKFKANAGQVSQILEKLKISKIEAVEDMHLCGTNVKLQWDDMPSEVHPAQGELPGNRVDRKCEQLENLARAVMHIAKPGQVIVDFCSGGGHLGIVLAHLLPECKVLLVENKEESIRRAEERIRTLGLNNIMSFQCNMNYFTGAFDIGICLHACGVATDLVLQRCIDQHASFVICPCCYGSIQNTHTLSYPRSGIFRDKNITYQEYLVLGHAADQTQVGIKQATDGKKCMLLIDTDRAESARQKGYQVTLCSLQPLSCSPKNDLLIGVLDR